jgi:hypothetical protein
MNTRLLLIVL